MPAITRALRFEREQRIASMLADGKNLSQIADIIGVRRQAVWQFCARRGLIDGPAARKWAAAAAKRNLKRRMDRRMKKATVKKG